MSTQVRVTYFGIDATGRTVTEAKRAAGELLERFVKHHEPRFVAFRGEVIALWPLPEGGVATQYVCHGGELNGCGRSYQGGTMDDAIGSAVEHIAQNLYPIPLDSPLWDQCPTAELRRKHRGNYAHWAGFQRAYKAAPAGLTECDTHRWACDHAHEFADKVSE